VLFRSGERGQAYAVGQFAEAQAIDLTGSSTELAISSTNSK
jgi:hypothetical protein